MSTERVHACAPTSPRRRPPLGLEGLPARHRPATQVALEGAGFTGRDLWRYMRADLPIAGLPHVAHYTVTDCEDPPGKRLEVCEGGELLAEATIGRPLVGIGVLWWIGVAQAARGRGLGLALLGSALDLLTDIGVLRSGSLSGPVTRPVRAGTPEACGIRTVAG
ncbi:GNAT family N-acetyltransferase [Streptomyces sp. NPDC056161]|uniref:GNAT family N-acetyltransferase n=1 Tax=Streptomyces sp. NPDC056161 TaxID=3345732 RepID=UPI0035DC428C